MAFSSNQNPMQDSIRNSGLISEFYSNEYKNKKPASKKSRVIAIIAIAVLLILLIGIVILFVIG